MKKKIMIGAVIPVLASLGLWLGLGGNVAANAKKPVAHAQHATQVRKASKALKTSSSGSDGDNIQSGDQNGPDTQASTSESDSSDGESTSSTETDGVDCQQDGNFEGMNVASTGPRYDSSRN